MKIGYYTENPTKEYCMLIRKAKNVHELCQTIELFYELVDDAWEKAIRMDEKDFKQFKKDLKQEKSGKFNDKWITEFNEKWGDIVMPRKLIVSTLIENKYQIPWGAAYIRCKEIGWSWKKKK